MRYPETYVARFASKLGLDILPATTASLIGGLLFAHYGLGRVTEPAAQVEPASAEMMQLLLRARDLSAFLNAQLEREKTELAAESNTRRASGRSRGDDQYSGGYIRGRRSRASPGLCGHRPKGRGCDAFVGGCSAGVSALGAACHRQVQQSESASAPFSGSSVADRQDGGPSKFTSCRSHTTWSRRLAAFRAGLAIISEQTQGRIPPPRWSRHPDDRRIAHVCG